MPPKQTNPEDDRKAVLRGIRNKSSVKGRKISWLAETMELRILSAVGRKPEREYRFHDTRKWRFDFAYPDKKLAIEVEGGVFVNGGHNRGVIYTQNCEKYNQAALLGWTVLRYTIKNYEQITEDVKRFLKV